MSDPRYELHPLQLLADQWDEFYSLPRDEARRRMRLFRSVISARVAQLEVVVRSDPAFASWRADRSRASLDPLSEWMCGHVHLVRSERTSVDVWLFGPPPPGLVRWGTADWATRDLDSILVDLTVYAAEVLRGLDATTKWELDRWNLPRLTAKRLGFGERPWQNLFHILGQWLEGTRPAPSLGRYVDCILLLPPRRSGPDAPVPSGVPRW
ncbi:MAG: hypothetical protein K2Q20_04695 [Phycisphaerales bacterium]|nr:hypothetical protein [Phycisphaerales bacterium]